MVALGEKLEQTTRDYLKQRKLTKSSTATDDRALQKIRDEFKRAMEIGDEKVELAVATYELVFILCIHLPLFCGLRACMLTILAFFVCRWTNT